MTIRDRAQAARTRAQSAIQSHWGAREDIEALSAALLRILSPEMRAAIVDAICCIDRVEDEADAVMAAIERVAEGGS